MQKCKVIVEWNMGGLKSAKIGSPGGSTEVPLRFEADVTEFPERFSGGSKQMSQRFWRGSLEVRHFLRHAPGTSSPEVPNKKEHHAHKCENPGMAEMCKNDHAQKHEPLRVSPPRQDAQNPEPLRNLFPNLSGTSSRTSLQTSFNIFEKT